MIQVLFVVIAAVGLAAALGTILARNLVRAALYLIGFFFTVACQFVLLEAEFLAALQVLIYIGAVAIHLDVRHHADPEYPGGRSQRARRRRGSCRGWWPGWACSWCSPSASAIRIRIANQKSWATMDRRPPISQPRENAPADRSAAVANMAKRCRRGIDDALRDCF